MPARRRNPRPIRKRGRGDCSGKEAGRGIRLVEMDFSNQSRLRVVIAVPLQSGGLDSREVKKKGGSDAEEDGQVYNRSFASRSFLFGAVNLLR